MVLSMLSSIKGVIAGASGGGVNSVRRTGASSTILRPLPSGARCGASALGTPRADGPQITSIKKTTNKEHLLSILLLRVLVITVLFENQQQQR